jgi:hypothetical protein
LWYYVTGKLFGQRFRILRPDLEGRQASDVSENRVASRFLHLGPVLIRDGQGQSVLSRFRKDCRKGIRGEILELVDVDKEVTTFLFRLISPTHCTELQARNEKCPEHGRGVFANAAFAAVHDQNPTVVHDIAKIVLPLSNDR